MNTITFKTRAQANIFENEIKGQISDGMWENTNGTDWSTWSKTEVLVGDNSGRTGYVRKTGFALERLIPIIGDRMIHHARLAIAYPEASFETLYKLESAKFAMNFTRQDDYYASIRVLVTEFGGLDAITVKLAAVGYSTKELRADLKAIKVAMKNEPKAKSEYKAPALTTTPTRNRRTVSTRPAPKQLTNGWRSPNHVQPIYQSTCREIIQVLIAMPRHYDHPVLGYFLTETNSWHLVGSPYTFNNDVTAWQPLPTMPEVK